MKKIFSILLLFCLINSFISWGPFPRCGGENDKTLDECDSSSLKTGLGCCSVELQDEAKTQYCILIGGYAQGWFTNQTEPVFLSNISFPHEAFNRTQEQAIQYAKELNETYYSSPAAVVKCVKNNLLSLKLATFLLIALFIIFL